MNHFVGAWGTLKARPVIFLVAPLASLVGLGALIDTVLYLLSYLFDAHNIAPGLTASVTELLPPSMIGPVMVELVNHLPWLLGTVTLFAIALWFQGALLHISYVHGKQRLHAHPKTAFRHSAHQLWRALMVHIASISAVFLLLLELDWLLRAIDVAGATWVEAPIVVLGSILIVFVLTVKMMALHRVFGADATLTRAVQDAWSMLVSSPIAIIEFNLLLFAINIVTYILLLGALTVLAIFAYAIGTTLVMMGAAPAVASVIEVALFVASAFICAGALTAFNMAAWSHLTKTLETRPVRSSLRHLHRTYLT